MTENLSSVGRHIRRHAWLSLALWLVVVGGVWAYLALRAARQPGSGDRFGVGGDSIALPVVALGLWLAIGLLAINLVAAVALVIRHRGKAHR